MEVCRLTSKHVAEYRAIMLQTYADESDAFTATVPERESLPLEWWAARVSDDPNSAELVFGAFSGTQLIGVAGLHFGRRERTKHKASLFGMSVLPQFRGQGVARQLIQALFNHARSIPDTRVIQLGVFESNTPAIQLYESCGFVPFGVEPLAIRLGGRFVPFVHMWCEMESNAA